MDLDQLSSMKYAELQKLAKEKLLLQAKLIQSLMELNWLSDDGTDKSADEALGPEKESKPKRGRKRGKISTDEIKEEESPPKNAPSKKSKIEAPEVELNSTFNVDTEEQPTSDNQSGSEPKPKVVRRRVRKAVRKSNPKLQETSEELETVEKTQEILNVTRDLVITSTSEEVSKPSEPLTKKDDQILNTTVEAEKTKRLSTKNMKVAKTFISQLKTPGQVSGMNRRSTTFTKATEVGKAAAATPMSTKKGLQLPSGTSTSKPRSRAAPNFAEIHQKQFEKMQSVDEYVEKKRQRTETMATSSAVKTIPRKRSTAKTPNESAKSRTPNPPVPAANPTPVAKTKLNFNFVSGIQKPMFTAQGLVATEKKRLMATLKENHHGQGGTAVKSVKKTSLNVSKLDLSSSVVANSNKSKQVSAEGQQQVLKGVRVNRRFQLQMQHRNLKN